MDELQDRLARIGLGSLGEYGFALAGGYALQAHGLVQRVSEDVDLFTDRWDVQDFAHAVEAVRRAYEQAGMVVVVARQADTFARLQVTDQDSDQVAMVDLAADFREREPVQLSIGPVLAERDAVAAKTAATFSRGEARDYLDLAGILASGHYSQEELIALAAQSDAGFDRAIFAEALAGVDRFPDRAFARYGAEAGEIARVRATMRDWSRGLAEKADSQATTPSGRQSPRLDGLPQDVDSPGERSHQAGPYRRVPGSSRHGDGRDVGFDGPAPAGPRR